MVVDTFALAQHHVKLAEEHESKGTRSQLSLAVREYREAHRLRPRDQGVIDRLNASIRRYKEREPIKGINLGRFVSHYNLSLRYWDEGKSDLALQEAALAVRILQKYDLPTGCAEHNLDIMKDMNKRYGRVEHQLLSHLDKAKSVGNMYRLGVVLFDKRMLIKAEEQMKQVENMIKAALALAHHKKDAERIESLNDDLEGVQDDIAYSHALRYNVNQSCEGSLKPCVSRRYDGEHEGCDQWWRYMASRADIDWEKS